MKSSSLHFSYDGEFIQDLARSAYWFENRREWAVRVLKCIRIPKEIDEDQLFYMQSRGLSFEQVCSVLPQSALDDEQIRAVLNGQARLTEDSKFVRESDPEFQRTLAKLHENMAEVGGIMVRRETLEDYFGSVESSRNAGESSPAYARVLHEAGFIKMTYAKRPRAVIVNSPESLAFRSALLKLAELRLRAKEPRP